MTISEALEAKIEKATTIRTIALLSVIILIFFFNQQAPGIFFAVGILIYILAIGLTFRLICCPKCGKNISAYLDRGLKGRRLRIPSTLNRCPFCNVEFEEQIAG